MGFKYVYIYTNKVMYFLIFCDTMLDVLNLCSIFSVLLGYVLTCPGSDDHINPRSLNKEFSRSKACMKMACLRLQLCWLVHPSSYPPLVFGDLIIEWMRDDKFNIYYSHHTYVFFFILKKKIDKYLNFHLNKCGHESKFE